VPTVPLSITLFFSFSIDEGPLGITSSFFYLVLPLLSDFFSPSGGRLGTYTPSKKSSKVFFIPLIQAALPTSVAMIFFFPFFSLFFDSCQKQWGVDLFCRGFARFMFDNLGADPPFPGPV